MASRTSWCRSVALSSFLLHPKRLQRDLWPGFPLQWPLRNNQASEWILPCQPRKSCREAAARLCRIQSMLPACGKRCSHRWSTVHRSSAGRQDRAVRQPLDPSIEQDLQGSIAVVLNLGDDSAEKLDDQKQMKPIFPDLFLGDRYRQSVQEILSSLGLPHRTPGLSKSFFVNC